MNAVIKSAGVQHLRPYKILDQSPEPRTVQLNVPFRGPDPPANPTLLETVLLISAARIVRAQTIFEFGTCRGETTRNLARNTEAHVFTLDLDDESASHIRTNAPDTRAIAMRAHVQGEDRITQLFGDSRRFDYSRWRRGIDFIFIDGGHDLETAASDTENALRMIRERGCIAWHDYGNPNYPELTAYLNNAPLDLVHIEDTTLCFHFAGGLKALSY